MEYRDFDTLSAVKELRHLAEKPFDLTSAGALSEDRMLKYSASSCGYDLLYGMQRIDDQVLSLLQRFSEEAELISKYMAMKRGEVINKIDGFESENRQVQHTSCRDVFSNEPLCKEPAGQAKKQLDRLGQFLEDLDKGKIVNAQGEKFTTMVQVGIGGSDLGPRALYQALKKYRMKGREARFIANVDPDDTAEVLEGLDLSRTLFNVVSKSGSTLETLTNEQLVRSALIEKGLEPRRHLVTVTGEGSPMDDPSNYLASFYMYDYIGGRYSVTSMVGGVTLGFALGLDHFMAILRGANDMDINSEQADIRENLALLMALCGLWNRNFLRHHTLAILPYSQSLARFPAHLQQCDLESNGKATSRLGHIVNYDTGPIVWGEPGTNGQHAFYQLLHQGTTIVPAEFIGYRKSQYGLDIEVKETSSQQKLVANMLAQSLALALGSSSKNPNKLFEGNRPNSVLIGEQLTPYSMGSLLALYENRIVFQGFCWNINSFDQEGVQLGKVLAGQILNEFISLKKGESGSLDSPSPERNILRAAGYLNESSM